MKPAGKRILLIVLFVLLGMLIGYRTAVTQNLQLKDPEYIAFFTDHQLPVPEPIGLTQAMGGFALLLSGIPTGLMLFQFAAARWFTSTAPKILLAILTFPIYTLLGIVTSIPVLLCNLYLLFRPRS